MIKNDEEFTHRFSPASNVDAFKAAWQQRATGGQREVAGYVPHYSGSPLTYSDQHQTGLKNSENHGCNTPLSGAKGIHSHDPHAGQHLSPLCFSNIEIPFEQLSIDFTLLYPSGHEVFKESFERAAASLGIPLLCKCIDTFPAHASTTTTTGERGATTDKSVLVRPDHFIAWVGRFDDAESPFDAMDARDVLTYCAAIES